MWCFLLCFSLPGLLCTLQAETHRPLHEYADGDVIIGGLFPIHSGPKQTFPSQRHVTCNKYNFQLFLCAQMMMFAIKRVNQRGSLPNVTLGYDVYDTCGDVSLAMRMALDMSTDQRDPQGLLPREKTASAPDPRVKAVIGESSSEVSIAVARILTLSSIAQISYASTSELLSKKAKFPTFLRTVNSDVVQTKAIAELVKTFNWESVGIVASDDEYGRYGREGLVDNFNKDNVCLDFKFILPTNLDRSNDQKQIIDSLMETIVNSTAEAIILFTKESNVKLVLEAAIQKTLNRNWIASDTWSNSSDIKELPGIKAIGSFFGIAFKSHVVAGFAEYISSMVEENSSNPLWEYHKFNHPPCSNAPQEKPNCSLTGNQCMETRCLVHYIFWDLSLNIYLAVEVIANALSSLMKCDREQCQRNTSFTAHELWNEIKNVNLTTVDGTHIVFDCNGNPMLGYDIVAWNSSSSGTIGEYLPGGKIILPPDLVAKMANVTITAFNCCKTCPVGRELTNVRKCCNNCSLCSDGYFSSEIGTQKCKKCKEGQYSSPERDRCCDKESEYLEWNNPFIITLSVFNSLGIVATITVVVIFVVNRGTPIVKAVGGYLSFLELFSLLTCFCLNFTLIGKPSKLSCFIGMPLFGMAFTLCLSCVLANLLQILVCFNFAQNTGGWLRKINQPPAVVAILFGVQLVLCSIWLAYFPPSLKRESDEQAIRLKCDLTSKAIFCAILSYVALLAIVSFLFAFNGKKLPDLYKNASFVTIGMLLVLVVWIIFIPVYLYGDSVYTEGIKAAAVLVSSYSMLCCHLVPKCYIMLCRKELNDEKAITDYIRNHLDQKGINILK